jgi:enediyne biosynthesis protein E4
VGSAQSAPIAFENVAQSIGLDFEHLNGASPEKHLAETMGAGAVFFDYNNDGWPDILLVDGGSLADRATAAKARHRLYRNRGNGTFEDVTAISGIRHTSYGMGACAADYDNDGWIDLYITNFGANTLYHNNGNGTFADVTAAAGVGSSLWGTSCAFADFDKDGNVDLFVTNYVDVGNDRFCENTDRHVRAYCHPLNYKSLPNVLYRNNGNGVFADVSAQSGIAGYRGNGLGVVVGDYDADGWPDVFVANDSVPNFLFHNEGRGSFKEVGLLAGVAVASDGKPRAGMGTDFGDYDGDGRLDLVVTNHEFETTSLFRNLGNGLFAHATSESGIGPPTLPFVGFGVVFFDYDNDGSLDLALINGHVLDNTAVIRPGSTHAQRRLLFRNLGDRRFADVSRLSGRAFEVERVGRTLAAADIDNDGDLDLLVTNNGQPVELLRNDGGNRNKSLLIRLVGKQSNRDGIGARLTLTAGSKKMMREVKAGSSYMGQNDVRVHFGLGHSLQAERLEIQWPSGKTDVVQSLRANEIVTIVEGQGISKRVPFPM